MSQYTQPAPRPERPPQEPRKQTKRTQGLSYKRKAPEPSKWSGMAVAPAERTPKESTAIQGQRLTESVIKIWGRRCLLQLPGCWGQATDTMHAYSKQAHPKDRYAKWMCFPGCRWCHNSPDNPLAYHNNGPTMRAVQEWADECRAADRNKKPQPTEAELQSILRRHLKAAGQTT